jgi:hypothetical protein
MAFDNINRILYATSFGNPGSLYTVDVATGTSTLVGSMGILPDLIGLAFDDAAQVLYANSLPSGAGSNGDLYTVNTITGLATIVGSNNVLNIDGLTFAPVQEICVHHDSKVSCLLASL